MSRTRLFILLLLLMALAPAHAIPPPDVVASLWQSVLQMLGVASVFLAGAWVAARQFFSQYAPILKRKVVFIPVLVGLLVLIWFAFAPSLSQAAPPAAIKGELLPIEQVIQRERDAWVRDWKLQTVREMKAEANLARQSKQLPAVQFHDVESFTPAALVALLKSRASELYLLDIREELERSKFSIQHQAMFRYGDLVQGLVPAQLPKDRLIVVLCHSGLRGYLGAHFLQQVGFPKVAFLQGGLAQWHKEGLPVVGEVDYKTKAPVQLSKREAGKLDAYKVQVDPAGTPALALGKVVQVPFETASTADLQPILQTSRTRPVLPVCKTYSGCFHGLNLIFLLEKQGGKVAGIYDETGQHLRGLVE